MTLVPRSNHYRWFVLGIVLLSSAIGFMIFAAPFPLLNLWVDELGISRAQAGALTGLWYLAAICVALPAGWLADRLPPRLLFPALWTLNVVGTILMASAKSFSILCMGRAIFSVGMIGYSVAAPKLLSIWFEGRKEFGLIMGLYSMSMTAGVYASLLFLGRIGERSGWRSAMHLLVVLVILGLLTMLFIRSQSPPSSGKESLVAHFRPLQLGMAAWILALAFGGYSIATEAYLTFTPDYLVQCGYGLAAASAFVGIYAWVALSLKPFLSFFLRRNNAPAYVMVASLIFMVSVALLLTRSFPPVVSAGAFGVSIALAMPALYALPPLLFGNAKSGQVYGLCQLFYGLGAIAQPLVGLTIDKTGHYTAGYAVICGFAGLSLFGASWLIRNNLTKTAVAQ